MARVPTGVAPKIKHRRRRNPMRRSGAANFVVRKSTRTKTKFKKRLKNPRTRHPLAKVGFVFSNDPDPMLVERMWALEETGDFEARALFWHRSSDLSFPFSPAPFSPHRFTQVNLADPCAGPLSRLWLTIVFAWSIFRWVRQHKFDVLHVVYPNMLIAAYIATLGRKVEIVYDIWDVNHSPSLSRIQKALYRKLLSKTRLVFTTSEAFINEFVEPNQIVQPGTVVKHVSNAPYAIPSNTNSARSNTKLGSPLVIGCVGNLRVPKQLQLLLDAVGRVRETGRDVRVRFSGAGRKKQLVSEAANGKEFVEYTGPYDYRRDATALYGALDLVYAVYPLENFNYRVHVARRLHDAVLRSTPIVVSRGTHMGEIVESQQVGWQIGHESTDELVELLTSICDDREMLTVKSIQATINARSHSFSVYRDTYVASYARLMGSTQKRSSVSPPRLPRPRQLETV